MPVRPTYPGVYIEEIPSGVHTITGVATSITAFIGRAVRGPANKATTITSFGDFERVFGGLATGYPLGYAVNDFYSNGGQQAVIVRVVSSPAAGEPATAGLNVGGLALVAASPGAWGNGLRARVTVPDPAAAGEVATRLGVAAGDLFNLFVNDTVTGTIETYLNVTVKDSAQRVDQVLASQSSLVLTSVALPDAIPTASAAVNPGDNPWDDTHSSKVTVIAIEAPAAAVADLTGDQLRKTGIYALDPVDLFNLLCIPPDQPGGDTDTTVYQKALSYCVTRRAMLIVDAPAAWRDASAITASTLTGLGLTGTDTRNAALYFPRVMEADPLKQGMLDTFPASGIIAGVMASTDAARGVWKAPAGTDASLNGIQGLAVTLTNDENGLLNPLGINCLRTFPVIGSVVWGARTLRGADQLGDEYKYVPVRRLALFIEESLYRGTQWAVFEPNDEPLWASIRLNVGSFMQDLFRQGAFQGRTPQEAYFVKCDSESTTQSDIDHGIVNILVGFAPLKPAEFVVIQIQQMAGQLQV